MSGKKSTTTNKNEEAKKGNISGPPTLNQFNTSPSPKKFGQQNSPQEAKKEDKSHDLITNINEDDLKERATAFQDDDEVQPLVLGETYSELFTQNRMNPKDRKPMPSLTNMI